MSKKKWYKYCIVPGCKNTSVTTPGKIFISLPSDENLRNLWQKAMRRDEFVSNKGTRCCCEDHFNVEEDIENYMYYTMMKGGKIRLKPGVIPHIFHCQKKRITEDDTGDLSVTAHTRNPERCNGDTVPERSNIHEKWTQVNFQPVLYSQSVQCNFPYT